MEDTEKRLQDIKQFGSMSRLVNMAVDRLLSGVSSLKEGRLNVFLENTDTNLHLEVAENTRKSAARLKDLVDKGLSVTVEQKEVQKVEVTNPTSINFPEIPKPLSEIRVSNLSEISIPEQKVDMLPLVDAVKGLKSVVSSINEQLPGLKPQKITFPKLEVPKQMSVKEAKDIIEALSDGLQGVRDDLGKVYEAINSIDIKTVGGGGGSTVVSSARVTDVNINGLRGLLKTTAVTVGTSATLLPPITLPHRRSLTIYNESSNDIYIGGADVTTSNGLPIPAKSYSPPLDAGEIMKVYAVAASPSAVRVFEASSEREGS